MGATGRFEPSPKSFHVVNTRPELTPPRRDFAPCWCELFQRKQDLRNCLKFAQLVKCRFSRSTHSFDSGSAFSTNMRSLIMDWNRERLQRVDSVNLPRSGGLSYDHRLLIDIALSDRTLLCYSAVSGNSKYLSYSTSIGSTPTGVRPMLRSKDNFPYDASVSVSDATRKNADKELTP